MDMEVEIGDMENGFAPISYTPFGSSSKSMINSSQLEAKIKGMDKYYSN